MDISYKEFKGVRGPMFSEKIMMINELLVLRNKICKYTPEERIEIAKMIDSVIQSEMSNFANRDDKLNGYNV